MLDFDLAEIYGTETKVLKQAIRWNCKAKRSNLINHVIRLDTFLQKNNVLSLQHGKE